MPKRAGNEGDVNSTLGFTTHSCELWCRQHSWDVLGLIQGGGGHRPQNLSSGYQQGLEEHCKTWILRGAEETRLVGLIREILFNIRTLA